MGTPGTPGAAVPAGDDWIKQELRDIHRRLDELASADILRTAGIETEPDMLRVVGSLNTTGALDVDGPMNVDGTMTVDGDATFGGAMAITGTLSLPAGIIDNEALAAPVRAGQATAQQSGFGTTLTDANVAVGTIAIPAGFTQALVMVVVTAGVVNSAPDADYLYLSARINGIQSREVFALAAAGAAAAATTSKSSLLTGLTGSSVTVSAVVHTQGNAWGANGVNRAYTEAIAIFLR